MRLVVTVTRLPSTFFVSVETSVELPSPPCIVTLVITSPPSPQVATLDETIDEDIVMFVPSRRTMSLHWETPMDCEPRGDIARLVVTMKRCPSPNFVSVETSLMPPPVAFCVRTIDIVPPGELERLVVMVTGWPFTVFVSVETSAGSDLASACSGSPPARPTCSCSSLPADCSRSPAPCSVLPPPCAAPPPHCSGLPAQPSGRPTVWPIIPGPCSALPACSRTPVP